jgi:hypothetical protein
MAKKVAGKKTITKKTTGRASAGTPIVNRDAWEDTRAAVKWVGKGIVGGLKSAGRVLSRTYSFAGDSVVKFPKTITALGGLSILVGAEILTLGGEKTYDSEENGQINGFDVIYHRDVGAFLFPKHDRLVLDNGEARYEIICHEPSRTDYSKDKINSIRVVGGDLEEIFGRVYSGSDADLRELNERYVGSADRMLKTKKKQEKEEYIGRVVSLGEGFLEDDSLSGSIPPLLKRSD